ncbi:MAG: ABC transporter permease [Alphaproteobacteria bacterium]
MLIYAIRRIGLAVIIAFSAMLLLFSLIHLIPGDPVSIALGTRATPEIQAKYIAKMGLDQPIYVQVAKFIGNVLQGDLGRDVFSDRPVSAMVGQVLPKTVILGLSALGWAAVLAIPLGCFSAVRRNSLLDKVTGVVSVGAIAVPSFVVSIWVLLLFSVEWRLFPVIGAGEAGDFWDQAWHLVLPAFAVGLGWVGYLARMVRASMLEVLGENYIRAARAFGLRHRTISYRYALKVAVLPTVTLIGVGIGGLLVGTVFAETIFSRPGLGKLIVDNALQRNFPVVQGAVLVTAFIYLGAVLVADLIAASLDPRVRQSL